jgi:hypothetical protein
MNKENGVYTYTALKEEILLFMTIWRTLCDVKTSKALEIKYYMSSLKHGITKV